MGQNLLPGHPLFHAEVSEEASNPPASFDVDAVFDVTAQTSGSSCGGAGLGDDASEPQPVTYQESDVVDDELDDFIESGFTNDDASAADDGSLDFTLDFQDGRDEAAEDED